MTQPPNPEPAKKSYEGDQPELSSPQALSDAIDRAFDYRGDVTLETAPGQTIEGYIFDRQKDGDAPHLRMMLPDGSRVTVPYADITRLAFTGKDTAAGKSWETWVKKYVENKVQSAKNNLPRSSKDDAQQ